MKSVYVETYGCQMNISDGELMEGILEAHGYEISTDPEEADVILVNTCAIREHAERRVLGRVGQLSGLKRKRPFWGEFRIPPERKRARRLRRLC